MASVAGTASDDADEQDEGDGALERFEWYRVLFHFSAGISPPKSAGYGELEDPDQNLVPQVCSSVSCLGCRERFRLLQDGFIVSSVNVRVFTMSQAVCCSNVPESLVTVPESFLLWLQRAMMGARLIQKLILDSVG